MDCGWESAGRCNGRRVKEKGEFREGFLGYSIEINALFFCWFLLFFFFFLFFKEKKISKCNLIYFSDFFLIRPYKNK